MLDDVFARAQATPSWCNTQPWRVRLIEGEELVAFGKALTEHVIASEQQADLGLPVYTGVHAERRRESGHELYAHLGIAREDRLGRAAQMLRNFTFFDAPHAVVVTTPVDLGTYGAVDCGGYVTTLMLLLQDAGLGAVAQGAIAMYSDFVRTHLRIGDDELVVTAVSFGHPDAEAEVNGFRTSRAPLDEVVVRIGG